MRFGTGLHARSGHQTFTFAWLAAIQRPIHDPGRGESSQPVPTAPAGTHRQKREQKQRPGQISGPLTDWEFEDAP